MKTKLTLFVTVLAVALFGMGCSSLDKGLVAYYPFNGNAKDESGNGNDGELNKVVLGKDARGEDGKAYKFNGDSSIILGSKIPHEKAMTVSAWVKTEQKSEWVNIVTGRRWDFLFGLKRGKLTFGGESNDPFAHDTFSTTALNDGVWHHAAASFDGSLVEIYVDGVLENSSKKQGVFKKSDVVIGHARVQGRPSWNMNGSIDDVRIYNRALSGKEVKALYDLEKPKSK